MKDRKTAEMAARQRKKRLADMAADPERTLHETENLVKERTGKAYRQIGYLLAELRESLINSDRVSLAEEQAQKLKRKYPTLKVLVAELRRAGFLKK